MALKKAHLEIAAKLTPKQKRAFLAEIGRIEFAKCAEDPIYWMDDSQHDGIPYVYTWDQHPMHECLICRNGEPHHFGKRKAHLQIAHGLQIEGYKELGGYFREMPTTRPWTMKPYMPPIINAWLTEPFIAWEKSRDMIATWTTIALYTWDTIFHRGRQNIFQSKKGPDTLELVKRAHFIWKNQPEWLRPYKCNFTAGETKAGQMRLEELNSEILGFAQGGDQIRQYHPTGLFADEAAFQTAAEDSFGAAKPALQNGGRYTAVSSANPSYFMLLCKDRSDEAYR